MTSLVTNRDETTHRGDAMDGFTRQPTALHDESHSTLMHTDAPDTTAPTESTADDLERRAYNIFVRNASGRVPCDQCLREAEREIAEDRQRASRTMVSANGHSSPVGDGRDGARGAMRQGASQKAGDSRPTNGRTLTRVRRSARDGGL